MDKSLWEKTVAFHGHACMGLALGFRAAVEAMKALQAARDRDEEIVAIVENDSCAVDAIQVVTGCTLGKGNLIYRDYGKPVYTFVLRDSGKAVRVVALAPEGEEHARIAELRRMVFSGEATEAEKQLFRQKSNKALAAYLQAPPEQAVKIEEVNCVLPEKARIFSSVTCAQCGEKVMEPRARVKDGRLVCIPCAGVYGRGW